MRKVLVDRDEHVATISLNRPEKKNAIDNEMRRGLYDAFVTVRDDPSIRVAIVRGTGDAFCAGHDLSEPLEGKPTVEELYEVQRELLKPLIAAISGACLAQGAGIALLCDIRLADRSAFFGWPQVKRGIASISGPTILAKAISSSVAMGYLLTGETIGAEQASSLQLVRLVEGPELMNAAKALAREVASNAPLAVQGMKRAVLATEGLSQAEAFRVAGAILAEIEQTEDAAEGMRAFAEKRAPVWRGR